MDTTFQILSTVLPVLIMLIIGMICRKMQIINRDGVNTLKSVVVNITLPTVLINAFATMQYSSKNILIFLMMFIICILAWALGKIMGKLVGAKSPFLPFLTTGFEAGMLGYALYMLLYGNETIGSFAGIDLGQTLFVFTLYKILLGIDIAKDQKNSAKELFMDMIKSPIIIAIIVGVFLGVSGLYQSMVSIGANVILNSITDFISAPTSAIILLTIGYDLVFQNVPWMDVWKVLISRYSILIVLRILAGMFVHFIGMGNTLDHALNVMLILPPPYVLPVFAKDEKEQAFLSSSLSVTTVITLLAFVILAVLGL